MKKAVTLILFVFFLLGYFLRTMYLKDNVLTFGYDQARDAIISLQIAGGDVKIQGPPASTPGLFHGVFYYYLLAPAYSLSGGSPIVAAYFVAFINTLALFVVFYLSYCMSGKKYWVGILASILFAVSFESTQYATWLSNPTTSVLTVPLMYLGLWMWLKEKNKFAPAITALGFGLSVQSEIFLVYHAVPLLIWLIAFRKKVTVRQIIFFVCVFVLSISTMIINEFKFGFRSLDGIISLLSQDGANLAYAKSLGDYLLLYLNQIGRIYAFNSFPLNIGIGGGFVLGLVVYSLIKKETATLFLSSWLLSHLSVVSIGGVSTPFLMVGIGPAVSIILALYFARWWRDGFRTLSSLVVLSMISGNLVMVMSENVKGSTLFSIQKDMLLSKQIELIDYTYHMTNGEMFSLNSLTSPLYINIVWDYLYKWHGQKEHGYIPEWHGKNQIGQLGELPKVQASTKNYFLILEPMGGIPKEYLELSVGEENTRSRLIDQKNFGELAVQKRIKL